jgi:putative ABC transport system ATP-binding protein
MDKLIEFKNIYKIYKMGETYVKAADNISITIHKGEFVAIVGQSGSGKSTCMNIIGCLDIPTSGIFLLGGKDVSEMNDNELAEVRNEMIGFIFQQYNLLPKLTVQDNVEVSMQYAGVGKKERHQRSKKVLERVGLGDKMKHLPSQLSGGQQQRVSVARALAGNPSVILADEPTGALDSKTGRNVLTLIQELHNEGNTIILITHDNFIAKEASRIIRLEDGHVIYDGPSDCEAAYITHLEEESES